MKLDIIRAWKDVNYRRKLNKELLAQLPAHPAGELSDSDLLGVYGGKEIDISVGSGSNCNSYGQQTCNSTHAVNSCHTLSPCVP